MGATLAPQSATPEATHNLVVAIRVTGTVHVRMKGITVDFPAGDFTLLSVPAAGEYRISSEYGRSSPAPTRC